MVPKALFKGVTVEQGMPISKGGGTVMEDLHNVILKTHAEDDLIMRFSDHKSRAAWLDSLENIIYHNMYGQNIPISGSKRMVGRAISQTRPHIQDDSDSDSSSGSSSSESSSSDSSEDDVHDRWRAAAQNNHNV